MQAHSRSTDISARSNMAIEPVMPSPALCNPSNAQFCRLRRLLVKADHISPGVAEACGNFRRIRTDRLHKLATVGDHGFNRGSDTVGHDVEQQPRRCGRRSAGDPGAAHFASCIVERDGTIASLPYSPAKDLLVELGRAPNISGWELDITDLAVGQ